MMQVILNEKQVAPFASQDHAAAVVEKLHMAGWGGVKYGGTPEPWLFDTVGQYNRFMMDFERAIADIAPRVAVMVAWACDCCEDEPENCHCGAGGAS